MRLRPITMILPHTYELNKMSGKKKRLMNKACVPLQCLLIHIVSSLLLMHHQSEILQILAKESTGGRGGGREDILTLDDKNHYCL